MKQTSTLIRILSNTVRNSLCKNIRNLKSPYVVFLFNRTLTNPESYKSLQMCLVLCNPPSLWDLHLKLWRRSPWCTLLLPSFLLRSHRWEEHKKMTNVKLIPIKIKKMHRCFKLKYVVTLVWRPILTIN